MGRILFLVVLFWVVFGRAALAVDLQFVAESGEYQAAADEYREIWREDGPRIVEALAEVTGATLPESDVRVIVREGVSRSGVGEQPMYLRASYPQATKRATLVHELGHRYLTVLDSNAGYSDVHFPLSLALYRIWTELWGRNFADEQAEVEAERSPRYRNAWDWVQSMSEEKRNKLWEDYLEGKAANHPSPR